MAGLKFWGAPTPENEQGTGATPSTSPRTFAGSRDEAELLIQCYESSGQGWFWSTDAEGRLAYLSESVAAQFDGGASKGAAFAELFVRADDEPGPLRTLSFLLAKQSKFEGLTVRPANAEGDRWWSLSGTPHFDAAERFTGFCGYSMDVTEARRSSENASQLALFDALTGLPNRLRMRQVLESALNGISHHNRACAVITLDLDRFKQVNDTLGHAAGDALLRQVAERLGRIVRDGEKIFRLGGDEFQIVLHDCADRGELGRIAAEVIAIVSQPYSINGSRCIIGASLGIAVAPLDGSNAEELTRNADLALYAAKDGGRGRFRFFSEELLKAAEDKRALESDIRDALARGEFELAYQPVVSARDNVTTGVEALARWNHPVRGAVSPADFVPLAEEANLIERLGEWTLRKACDDAVSWPGRLRVAVNVSPIQFTNENFPQIVLSALASSGLPADRLELEITEGVFLRESTDTDAMFKALKSLGVRLALDDFGTGYSSLSYLKTAPFDKIKIDKSFVREATLPESRNGAIIAAIVALAEALGMETTAEGIESLDQLELARALRVSHIQGFVYSSAISTDELAGKLASGSWTIEPTGPSKQRSSRQSMYRKAGAIFGNHYQSVLIRNLSDSGALIEGLPDLPMQTLFLIDFGGGELVFARARRRIGAQHGVEFEESLVPDGDDGLCARHRVSPYALREAGLPGGPGDYPAERRSLHQSYGTTIEKVAGKLGLNPASVLRQQPGSADGSKGGQGAFLGLSLMSGNLSPERRLAPEDVERLLGAARASGNPQLKHIVSLLMLTGARQRELLEARWEHVDLAKGEWRVPDARAGGERIVKLSKEAIEAMRELPRWDDCAHLLCNPATKKPYRSFASSWETARKKADLPYVEIDELRHCAGMTAAQKAPL